MKIYAVSDLHGNLDGMDPGDADVVVIAGDLAPMKGWSVWHINDQVKWINKKFAAWCGKYPATEFVIVPGNHDLFAQRTDLPTKIAWPKNTHFLIDKEVEVKGLRFAGTPWIPPISGRWAFEARDEDDLARHFAWIPDGVDVLIAHSPPFVEGWDVDVSLQTQSPHFGSRALTEAIQRVKPTLFFCGHIHTGDHRVHDLIHDDGSITKLYNVSRLNEDYRIAYEPLIEYACRKEDMSRVSVELDDELAASASEWLSSYGLTLELFFGIFIEEFVLAKGDSDETSSAVTQRLNRIVCTRNAHDVEVYG